MGKGEDEFGKWNIQLKLIGDLNSTGKALRREIKDEVVTLTLNSSCLKWYLLSS